MAIPVYILAGGRSLRFGDDKALAQIGGRAMITVVAEQWRASASRLIAVADRVGKYDRIGLRTIADSQLGLGPIGGLFAALEDCCEGWLLLTACDTLILDPELPQRLLSELSDDVKVIAIKGSRWEPMPALYHCSILPVVRTCVAQGQRALWKMIESVPRRAIVYAREHEPIAKINTREEMQKLLAAGNL